MWTHNQARDSLTECEIYLGAPPTKDSQQQKRRFSGKYFDDTFNDQRRFEPA